MGRGTRRTAVRNGRLLAVEGHHNRNRRLGNSGRGGVASHLAKAYQARETPASQALWWA